MFCKYCGSEMSGGEEICPGCGRRRVARPVFEEKEIKESIEEEDLEEEGGYIILPGFQGEKRRKFNIAVEILFILIGLGFLGKVASHVVGEFQAAENYKFLLYVIRFVNVCAPYIAHIWLVGTVRSIFLMRKKYVGAGSFSKLVIGLMVVVAVLAEASGHLLVSSPGLEDLQILAAVADNSFLDYLAIIKDGVIVFVLAEVLSYVCTKIMEKDGIEAEDVEIKDLF